MKTYKKPILKLHKLKMQVLLQTGSEGTAEETKTPHSDNDLGAAKQATFSLDDNDFDKE